MRGRTLWRLVALSMTLVSLRYGQTGGNTAAPRSHNAELWERPTHDSSDVNTTSMSMTDVNTTSVTEVMPMGAATTKKVTTFLAEVLIEMTQVYGYTAIGAVAIVGNVLNLMVLLGNPHALSPYTYLSALAACDLITGVVLFWSGVFTSKDLMAHSHGARLLMYHTFPAVHTIRESISTIASFLVMVLGVDRLIAVKFPLHRSSWCTVTRARWITALCSILGFLVNAHMPFRIKTIWMWDAGYQEVLPRLYYTKLGLNPEVTTIVLYLTLIFRISIPLVTLIITNTITLRVVLESQRFRQQASKSQRKTEENAQCMAMTIGVIIIFIITNIPRAAYYINLAINGYPRSLSYGATVAILVAEVILWSNACINFFIYALLNAKFRHDVLRMLGLRKSKHGGRTELSTSSMKTEMTSTM